MEPLHLEERKNILASGEVTEAELDEYEKLLAEYLAQPQNAPNSRLKKLSQKIEDARKDVGIVEDPNNRGKVMVRDRSGRIIGKQG